MSFATTLALLVGLLIFAPVLAHLLRRGKTKELDFPPAHLVPNIVVTSEQRRRLEDRLLLLLRALMVLALAVLGATPFVRCSRLSVDRESGASVAMALLIDDSHSMRALTDDGTSRFEAARRGAEQLLASAREGDAIAIILAGHPARLALSATTDLNAARDAVEALQVTDRGTDLLEAANLGRSALKELPHVDKRVVLLSDLRGDELTEGEPPVWTPLPKLADSAPNCGIASAEQQGRAVVVTVGCDEQSAAQGRAIELLVASEPDGAPLLSEPLLAASGEQRVSLKYSSLGFELLVRLTGEDRIRTDDQAYVTKEAAAQVVGVVVDAARASVMTGGATVVEQALTALDPDLKLRPLSAVPEATEDFTGFSLVIVDDPPGLSPAARAALSEWLERGGVAIGLLGPTSTSAQLAATLEPFAREGAQWERNAEADIESESLGWLGPEGASLQDLLHRGRVRLDAAELPGTEVVGKWTDDTPFLFRRAVGRGLVFTAGLPVSVEISDLALRPGFLALLSYVLDQGRQRKGPKQGRPGAPWLFSKSDAVSVTGPGGAVKPEPAAAQPDVISFTPELAGRYEVHVEGKPEARFVTLDAKELTTPPLDAQRARAARLADDTDNQIDASPEWALFVLGIFSVELFFRVFGERLRRRFQRA